MRRPFLPTLVLLLAAASHAWADDPSPSTPAAIAAPADAPAAAAPASRWTALGSSDAGSYRVSLTNGAVDLGVRFAPRLAAVHATDGRYDSAAPAGATLPSLSVGVQRAAGAVPASTLIDRAVGAAGPAASVSKVGVEWKPAQSQVFFHQGLGVRLGGEDRLIMRLRKGSLGLYMQTVF